MDIFDIALDPIRTTVNETYYSNSRGLRALSYALSTDCFNMKDAITLYKQLVSRTIPGMEYRKPPVCHVAQYIFSTRLDGDCIWYVDTDLIEPCSAGMVGINKTNKAHIAIVTHSTFTPIR